MLSKPQTELITALHVLYGRRVFTFYDFAQIRSALGVFSLDNFCSAPDFIEFKMFDNLGDGFYQLTDRAREELQDGK